MILLRARLSLAALLVVGLTCWTTGCGGGSPTKGSRKAGGFSRGADDDPPAAAAQAPQGAPQVRGEAPVQRLPARTAAAPIEGLQPGQSGVALECGGLVRGRQFYLKRFPAGPGKPTVVQLSTSQQEISPEFPAVFFLGETSESDANTLIGKTLRGRMFVQPDANGPIFHSTGGGVEVRFTAVDDEFVDGEIFESQLICSEGGRRTTVSGAFIATTREVKRRVKKQNSGGEDF